MNILALDLATVTGYAMLIGGGVVSGIRKFERNEGEHAGYRFYRFSEWLEDTIEKHGPFALLVYERPMMHHKSGYSAQIAWGFSTRVEEFGAIHQTKVEAVSAPSVKKLATGRGNAQKFEMVRAAQVLKRGVCDDNEADALWLLEYARVNFVARS